MTQANQEEFIVTALIFIISFLVSIKTGRGKGLAISSIACLAGSIVTASNYKFGIFLIIPAFMIFFVTSMIGVGIGGYFYKPLKPKTRKPLKLDFSEYVSVSELAKEKNISEEKAIEMIKDGFFIGRIIEGGWRIHKSELEP